MNSALLHSKVTTYKGSDNRRLFQLFPSATTTMPATSHAGTTSDSLGRVYQTFLPHLQRLFACALDVKDLEECYRALNRSDAKFCGAFLEQLRTCAPFLHFVDIVLRKMCISALHLDYPVRKMLGKTIISVIHTLKKKYEGHNWRIVDVPQILLMNLRLKWDDLHKQLRSLRILLWREYGDFAPRIEELTSLKDFLRQQWQYQLVRAATKGAYLLKEEEKREGWATGSS